MLKELTNVYVCANAQTTLLASLLSAEPIKMEDLGAEPIMGFAPLTDMAPVYSLGKTTTVSPFGF